ncbi:MAG: WD repeat protein Lub1, partial [Paramarteilia canceri]
SYLSAHSRQFDEQIASICCPNDAETVYLGTYSGNMITYNYLNDSLEKKQIHDNTICSLRFAFDDQNKKGYLSTASWDFSAKIYENMNLKYTLSGHTQTVWDCVFDPKNECAVTCSADKTIKVWSKDVLKNTISEHPEIHRCLALLDYNCFVSGSNDGSIIKWNYSGEKILKLGDHSNFVYSLEANYNEKIVSSGEDGCVKIWKSNKLVDSVKLHCCTCWKSRILGENIISITE